MEPRVDDAATSEAAVLPPGFDTAFLRHLLSPHVPRMDRLMAASDWYVVVLPPL